MGNFIWFRRSCLFENEETIGRRLIDSQNLRISNNHFVIRKTGENEKENFILKDISTNGTYLNDSNERIMKETEVEIKPMDIIVLKPNDDENPMNYYSFLFIDKNTYKMITNKCNNFFERYTFGRLIGTGTFGKVFEITENLTHQKYALKILNISEEKRREKGKKESNIMKDLHHKNIIEMIETIDCDEWYFIIMELCLDGDLLYFIENHEMKMNEMKYIMKNILEGIDYLHSQMIVHRDIKLENILVKKLINTPDEIHDEIKNENVNDIDMDENDLEETKINDNSIIINSNSSKKSMNEINITNFEEQFQIKITDFGLSRIVGKDFLANTICGTKQYISPEMYNNAYKKKRSIDRQLKEGITEEERQREENEIQKLKYNAMKSDIWACGVVFYQLALKKQPFKSQQNGTGSPKSSNIKSIIQGKFIKDEKYEALPDDFKDLLEKMIVVDPEKRLSARECLNSEFFVGRKRSMNDVNFN